jgi:hypothetical protein
LRSCRSDSTRNDALVRVRVAVEDRAAARTIPGADAVRLTWNGRSDGSPPEVGFRVDSR